MAHGVGRRLRLKRGGVPSATVVIAVCASVLLAPQGTAQSHDDLLIANARIIDGTGRVIREGYVAIEGGRIRDVSTGTLRSTATTQIDGGGLTVLPGLIDTHRHVIESPEHKSDDGFSEWMDTELQSSLRAFLEAGITTVLSTGDYFPTIIDVKIRLEEGDLLGPRLLVSGPVFTAPDGHPAATICRGNPWCRERLVREVDSAEDARRHVRELAAAGVDAVKAVYDRDLGAAIEIDVLAAIGEEAARHDLPLLVHAGPVDDMTAFLQVGVDGFVHPVSSESESGPEVGRLLARGGIPVSTTVGVRAAYREEGGVARTPYGGVHRPEVLAQRLTTVRELWDQGVTIAYGTDTPMHPAESLRLETSTLNRVLTPREILAALTVNAATFLRLRDEIGSIEPGKVADLLVVRGDPLVDIAALANVVVVVRDGRIVVDNR